MEVDSSTPVGILVLLLFLILEMLFYGFGTAIQSISEHQIEEKANAGDRKSVKLMKIITSPIKYVNTLQITVCGISMIIGYWQVPAFSAALERQLFALGWLAGNGSRVICITIISLLLLFILVIIGITVPKELAANAPKKWSYRLVTLMYGLSWLFRPFTYIVSGISHLILKLFGIKLGQAEEDVTEEEIISVVNEGHEQGVLEDSEAEMIHNIIALSDKEASDIMTHRKNMVMLEGESTLREISEFIMDQNYSRFPVFTGDSDNIIGIVHFKDVMKFYREASSQNKPILDIPDLIRPVSFIPETKNVNQLFQTMQSQNMHMSIVVDEYGQTAGLIAMEDILEEIVGNILDEYDEEECMILSREDGSYLVNGMTPLDELDEVLEITFDTADIETLNGFLISELDQIPEAGKTVELTYKGYHFIVQSVENNRIETVLIQKEEQETVIASNDEDLDKK